MIGHVYEREPCLLSAAFKSLYILLFLPYEYAAAVHVRTPDTSVLSFGKLRVES